MSTTFFKSATLVATLATLFTKVAAHGYVSGVQIGGNWYEGFKESTWEDKANGSPILITSYLLPLYDVWNSQIACGLNPKAPQQHAAVQPDQYVEWKWNTHDAVDWIHDKGTHRSFIGACKGDCANISPNDIEWIELGEEYTGRQNYDSGSGTWPAIVLTQGQRWSDKIPHLPNGKYLLRNELTAMHYSYKQTSSYDDGHPWGTEFYPSCIALEISGSDGSFVPGQTWKFPGSYQTDEAGHYNPDFQSNPGATVMAALSSGQGYTNYYTDQPSGGSTNSNSNTNNNSNNNSNNNTPAADSSSSTTTAAAASTSSTATPQVCKRGARRAKRAAAAKMRRSHLAHRRSEH